MANSLILAHRTVVGLKYPPKVAFQLQLDPDASDDLADGAGVDAVVVDLHLVLSGQGTLMWSFESCCEL